VSLSESAGAPKLNAYWEESSVIIAGFEEPVLNRGIVLLLKLLKLLAI